MNHRLRVKNLENISIKMKNSLSKNLYVYYNSFMYDALQ